MNTRSRLYEFDKNQLQSLRKLVVVGDLHGDYNSLMSVLKVADPEKDAIVFLGDYADRGKMGIEVIDGVKHLMKTYPKVVALKGNHEDYEDSGNPKSRPCDLQYEATIKRGGWQRYFQDELKPFLESLYLAAIIPGEVLFVHGGVSSKIKSLDDLRHPTKEVEEDVLWSDPVFDDGEEFNYDRYAGVKFGNDVTENVCRLLNVKRIIRSHEPDKTLGGVPFYEHDLRVITTSSTRAYTGSTPIVLIIDPNNPSNISYDFL